jgi:hypothetical protein
MWDETAKGPEGSNGGLTSAIDPLGLDSGFSGDGFSQTVDSTPG